LWFAPQPHHHADYIVTALDQERGNSRTINAATHRDDDGVCPIHSVRLNFLTTSATAPTARSTSASVLPRPNVKRNAPRATSGA
jgi:hypothetical protein